MGVLMRAVVTGFGFSLGSALFRKMQNRLGLADGPADDAQPAATSDDREESEEAEPQPA